MKRPGRLRRIARRIGLGASEVLAVAWLLSGFGYLGWQISDQFGVAINDGSFGVLGERKSVLPAFDAVTYERWQIERLPDFSGLAVVRTARAWVPLWIPFLIIAIPTVYLIYRDRRRFRPGHCEECGYNLTGNVSGTCPECGERA